jgi:hypothetical protein
MTPRLAQKTMLHHMETHTSTQLTPTREYLLTVRFNTDNAASSRMVLVVQVRCARAFFHALQARNTSTLLRTVPTSTLQQA